MLHRFIVVLVPAEKLSGFLRTPLIRSRFSLTITLKLNSTRLKLQLTHGTFFFFEKKPSFGKMFLSVCILKVLEEN